MFYRRILLLGLIESFGGKLKRTDCQKLLFVYRQVTGRNHYDFFPYHFGSFSFVANYDKKRLTELGLLSAVDDYELRVHRTFLSQLKPEDRSMLQFMSHAFKNVKGKSLIKKVYLEYPAYTCRSEILSEVLSPSEQKQVKNWWNCDTAPRLFTIGYQGLTIDAFLDRLITNNVSAIVDVRKNPISMKYGFSKTQLKHYIESAGLAYFHLPDLGIPSNLRQHLDDTADYKRLFKYYQTSILPKQTDALEQLEDILSKYHRASLVCFESDHEFCHRHKITEYLDKTRISKYRVVHL